MGCGHYRDPYISVEHVERHGVEALADAIVREIRKGSATLGFAQGSSARSGPITSGSRRGKNAHSAPRPLRRDRLDEIT